MPLYLSWLNASGLATWMPITLPHTLTAYGEYLGRTTYTTWNWSSISSKLTSIVLPPGRWTLLWRISHIEVGNSIPYPGLLHTEELCFYWTGIGILCPSPFAKQYFAVLLIDKFLGHFYMWYQWMVFLLLLPSVQIVLSQEELPWLLKLLY